MKPIICLLAFILLTVNFSPSAGSAEAAGQSGEWLTGLVNMPYAMAGDGDLPEEPVLWLIQQQYEALEYKQSVIKTPMRIGERSFERGLGTHANSHIRIFHRNRLSGWKPGSASITTRLRKAGKVRSRLP